MTKVIYLKAVFKGHKPDKKITKLIDEAIVKSNGLDVLKKKKGNPLDSRKFILKHTEEFLHYAVDYSLYDKVTEGFQE